MDAPPPTTAVKYPLGAAVATVLADPAHTIWISTPTGRSEPSSVTTWPEMLTGGLGGAGVCIVGCWADEFALPVLPPFPVGVPLEPEDVPADDPPDVPFEGVDGVGVPLRWPHRQQSPGARINPLTTAIRSVARVRSFISGIALLAC